jgi:hypothetical protein
MEIALSNYNIPEVAVPAEDGVGVVKDFTELLQIQRYRYRSE